MSNTTPHTFHIPVMGLAFTIDTPIKVAKYGISSVVSIMEDHLIEQMREVLCKSNGLEYVKINISDNDYRAKRITAYLNLMQDIIDNQIEALRIEDFDNNEDINKYFEMLPDNAYAKIFYNTMLESERDERKINQNKLRKLIVAGKIDVNIMTKLDKTNYDTEGNELPTQFSDALAALRGYANSRIESSIVFSAGLNPRLFSYCENFEDFYPNLNGQINKKIILKVSDYRSALIQGKYLAKKGLWISEFRIESGINCGGHAFISNGIPFGPILEEFKLKRNDLYNELLVTCVNTLKTLGKNSFLINPELKITAQGGIGTSEENSFLIDYYNLDSTGWGSPFLLVPEATNVDSETLNKLKSAKKEDYYLSHSSPLGVPFNNFRNSSSDKQRKMRMDKNRPGSPCYKKFLSMDKEFTDKPICTASREYQNLKIKQLKSQITDLNILEKEIEKITEKECLCEGLGASALLVNNTKLPHNLSAVTICPGPNLKYFSDVFSLKQMVDHIYGRLNILNNLNRPNIFVNELRLYFDYLKKEIEEQYNVISEKKLAYFQTFKANLLIGIDYYEGLIPKIKQSNTEFKNNIIKQLKEIKSSLNLLPLLHTAQS
ncbi:MAG: hypothetical protein JNM95_15425 [Chitinophagaceae bacterium]|nr:hypothetical protein [Chitinophagaceae bacterium]